MHTRESAHSVNWEKQVQQVRVQNRLSFPEARKLTETAAPKLVGRTYAAVAAAPKPITKSVAVNTELTWHSDDAKYRKLSDIAKTDKQVQKAAEKQKDKTSIHNKESQKVSLDLKNPSNGSSTSLPKTGKDTKKVEQRLQIGNSFQNLTDLEDDDMDISHDIQKPPIKTKITPILPPMTNSVIQWNCRGLRLNLDELTVLIVKYNRLAICLQETFMKDTYNITVRGFNLYHKCQETEDRASGGVSILVNENIPKNILKLNTNLQAVAVKVTAHKTITLCSVYLPPRNQLKFNPKDLQDVIDQLPSPFILMGDFNGHHTLWGCEDVNNRGQQLEDLILNFV